MSTLNRVDSEHWTRFRRLASVLPAILHIALEIKNVRGGMPKDVTRERDHRKFGNTTLIREEVYRMNGPRFLETLAGWALCIEDDAPQVDILLRWSRPRWRSASERMQPYSASCRLCSCNPFPTKILPVVAIWDKNVRDSGISKMFDSFQDFREVTQHVSSFEEVAGRHMGSNPEASVLRHKERYKIMVDEMLVFERALTEEGAAALTEVPPLTSLHMISSKLTGEI